MFWWSRAAVRQSVERNHFTNLTYVVEVTSLMSKRIARMLTRCRCCCWLFKQPRWAQRRNPNHHPHTVHRIQKRNKFKSPNRCFHVCTTNFIRFIFFFFLFSGWFVELHLRACVYENWVFLSWLALLLELRFSSLFLLRTQHHWTTSIPVPQSLDVVVACWRSLITCMAMCGGDFWWSIEKFGMFSHKCQDWALVMKTVAVWGRRQV